MDRAGVFVLVIAVIWLTVLLWAIKRAPVCTCNRPDCGGGCLKR